MSIIADNFAIIDKSIEIFKKEWQDIIGPSNYDFFVHGYFTGRKQSSDEAISATVSRLKDDKYIRHLPKCQKSQACHVGAHVNVPCTCGLDSILKNVIKEQHDETP